MSTSHAAVRDRRLSVLFLCTGNACRSQMAEGWARALWSDTIDAHSAGTHPHGLNPLAVRAMREAGIDISHHHSKRPEQISAPIDVVVTVCDAAHEACPVLPGAVVIHAGFDDPPRLAAGAPDEASAMVHYRRVRDEIRRWVESMPDLLARAHADLERSGAPTPTQEIPMTRSSTACCSTPGCCSPGTSAPDVSPSEAARPATGAEVDPEAVREQVRAGYGEIARRGSWSSEGTRAGDAATGCAPGGGCCGPATFTPEALAAAIGYSSQDLAHTPDGANMGLSCGNPTAIAALRPGEVVVDLGAGGGFDCFVAGPRVGASGRVIGVDMTPDMVSRARKNAAAYRAQSGLDNVEFRLGEIEHLPVADASVDVVISNCVLNLSPDKPQVWREIARVLRGGGRVAVSDLALIRPLPESVRQDVEALVGCIAGAVLVEETRRMAQDAGLVDIVLTPKPEYIDAMSGWEDPLYRRIVESLPAGTKPSDFITSLDISARRVR
ncbi:MAG: arsenite methyltransferase [Phycisphaeraceae bacterium]|nr:arsenite methyltransferase [Phycisphaeraceae bacterium]